MDKDNSKLGKESRLKVLVESMEFAFKKNPKVVEQRKEYVENLNQFMENYLYTNPQEAHRKYGQFTIL